MEYEFKIIKYNILNETVESSFVFQLYIKNESNQNCIYNLKLPSNPLVDIDILHLHGTDIYTTIDRIKYIINKKRYSYKTNNALKLFLNWLVLSINSSNHDCITLLDNSLTISI